jgi:hypothetical protein
MRMKKYENNNRVHRKLGQQNLRVGGTMSPPKICNAEYAFPRNLSQLCIKEKS